MSTSQRLIDEPTVGAIAALILHQLYDTLEGAMDYAREAYPADDRLDDLTPWMNGAIYGVVASFVRGKCKTGDRREIDTIYRIVCEMTVEFFRDGGILDTEPDDEAGSHHESRRSMNSAARFSCGSMRLANRFSRYDPPVAWRRGALTLTAAAVSGPAP